MAANWPKDNYTPDKFAETGLDGEIIEDEWGEDVGATLNELTADLAAALEATDVSFDTIEEAVAVWAQRNAVVFTGLGSPVVEIDAVPTGSDTLAFKVWCENGYERRAVFVIENNVTSVSSKLVDVNLRNCVVNVGDASATESFEGTKIRILQPPGATGNLIEVLVAGSQTAKAYRVANSGAVFINSRGIASRAFAINTATGDTNGWEPWFAINESGQIAWGPGGSGSALDVTLGRAASGVIEVGGKIRQTGTPTASTDLATVGYVNSYEHSHEIGSPEGQINFHDLEGLPQRFAPEVHAWNDAAIHAGPTLALPVTLMIGNTGNASVTLPNGAGNAAEYSTTKRHRAPVDLSAARWLRVLIRSFARGSADARFRLGVTTDGSTFTMLTDSTGAVLDWAVPDASEDFDSGVVDLHPAVQQLGNSTMAVFVYGTGSGTVTIEGCRLLIGVLG